MKLNPDCIRDILLSIEEVSNFNSLLTSEQLSKSSYLAEHSKDEILYHLHQLELAGYIIAPSKQMYGDVFLLNDLSPLGHEFLSDIRQDTNWNKIKSISKDVGTETLTSIKTIAGNVISSAISTMFGLH